jgi:hypothetical protein
VSIQRGDPSNYQHALRHLAQVNGWDSQTTRTYLEEKRETFRRREALGPWVQDVSARGVG